ncbi:MULTISPECIES: hypothetical protein [unclassified Marinobacter]|nr:MULTISPECIES: hypothetical protein [unclassified Marinobacter]MDO6443407.1 hypothetical protein [Marinobacter sp. 2_MG-2023]MDO6824195.1 hypothetical protein [Marinobacter sp. 1_MG-2023]
MENDDFVEGGSRYVINNEWRANVTYTTVEVDDNAGTNTKRSAST